MTPSTGQEEPGIVREAREQIRIRQPGEEPAYRGRVYAASELVAAYEAGLQATLARPDRGGGALREALEFYARDDIYEHHGASRYTIVGEDGGQRAHQALALPRGETQAPPGYVVEALALILPLAKGYAAEHPVGSNAEYVAQAERVLAACPVVGDCDHAGWSFSTHGRGCPKCGNIVLDFGD